MNTPIRFELSERKQVREFLAATAADIFPALHAQVEQARAQLLSIRTLKDEEMKVWWKSNGEPFYRERRRLEDEFWKARDADEKYWLPDGTRPENHKAKDQRDAENAASCDRMWTAWRAFKDASEPPPYTGPSERDVAVARDAVSRAEARVREATERITRAEQALGDRCTLDRDILNRVARFTMSEYLEGHERDGQWGTSLSDPEVAGMLRGELTVECPGCEIGHISVDLVGDGSIQMILDDQIRHPICYMIAQHRVGDLDSAVPATFRQHRLHSLKPWKENPLALEEQARLISRIPTKASNLRGWVMLGPPGTSKTTFAAAAVLDMLTLRSLDQHSSHPSASDLNYWRVKVPKWLRDMEAWDHRDFGDDDAVRPEIDPHLIGVASARTAFAPLLWLEEIDKFNPTPNRLRLLFTLIDAVYEAGGLIITTANEKRADLQKLVGDPIWRRLTGCNDHPDDYLLWELWPSEKRGKRSL